MSEAGYAVMIDLGCFIVWSMVWLPCLLFLRKAWRARRDHLLDVFDDKALQLYYKRFLPALDVSKLSSDQLKLRFRRRYHSLYGKRWYVPALLLLACAAAIAVVAVAETVRASQGVAGGHKVLPPIALAALLGALLWVVNDQLSRLRNRDFSSHDVYNCVFRLIFAIPLGIALSRFVKDDLGIPVAFLLGTFPTQTVFQFGRRLVSQRLGLGEQGSAVTSQLEKLQCVGKSNAERFMDEGITTIAELAWFDPVDLTIRSNREFNYITDCVSQALLWIYFEDKVEQLYPLSLRGGQEVYYLVDTLKNGSEDNKLKANKSVDEMARVLGIDRLAVLNTLDQVAYDPYTEFLVEIWG